MGLLVWGIGRPSLGFAVEKFSNDPESAAVVSAIGIDRNQAWPRQVSKVHDGHAGSREHALMIGYERGKLGDHG